MAQAGYVKPEVLDSASARLRDHYVSLRDTLHIVTGGSAVLQRDVRYASDPVVLSRARRIESACNSSLRGLDQGQEEMLNSGPGRKAPTDRRVSLQKSFNELNAALTACSRDFKVMGERGNEPQIRNEGPGKLNQVQVAVRNFEGSADEFLRSVGIRVRPHGAGPSSLAGSPQSN